MALGKRQSTDRVIPEVEQYYQAERRDRGWLAWVLAFVSVAVVVSLFVGVYFGGRWVYREITKNSDAGVQTSDNDVQETTQPGVTVDGDPNNVVKEDEQTATAPIPEPKATPTTPPKQEQGAVNAPAQTTTPSAIPRTGDSSLPNTGPSGLIAAFTGVSVIAGGLHHVVSKKRR